MLHQISPKVTTPAEKIACKIFPRKYRPRPRPVSLSTAAVCPWTDSPPQPRSAAAHTRSPGLPSKAVTPVVSSARPKRAGWFSPVRSVIRDKITRKNTTKPHSRTIPSAASPTARTKAAMGSKAAEYLTFCPDTGAFFLNKIPTNKSRTACN